MFAVIYKGKVKPEKEKLYQQSWKEIASFFVNNCGALGSCLHKADDNIWIAYSRWSSKEHRDNAWPGIDAAEDRLPKEIKTAFLNLKQCISESYPETCMEVVEDLIF